MNKRDWTTTWIVYELGIVEKLLIYPTVYIRWNMSRTVDPYVHELYPDKNNDRIL